jgi:8-oxo-dGTP diphosphatase
MFAMGEISKTILTNMCMLYDGEGHYLVQKRLKQDWPGLNFPGGHVERDESLEESVVREMKEETGLDVKDLEQCGVYEWNVPQENLRHLAILYRSCHYEGKLVSSGEGPMLWLDEKEIAKEAQSVDFDKLFALMKRGI